jgi:hypothetical protein
LISSGNSPVERFVSVQETVMQADLTTSRNSIVDRFVQFRKQYCIPGCSVEEKVLRTGLFSSGNNTVETTVLFQ